MSKPENVHAFFAKLAAAVSSTEEKPSLKMLHRAAPVQGSVLTGSLQEILNTNPEMPNFFALELKDFGVGLPPMARC